MTYFNHLLSPIKQAPPFTRTHDSSPLSSARALFTDPCETPETLSELYNYNLDAPGLLCDSREFFEIRDAVEAIEKIIESSIELTDRDCIRERVRHILKQIEHRQKMVELGMTLFYLDRDLKLPMEDSFLSFRAAEINNNVTEYTMQHRVSCANPLIPSGKTHYLMRAFAHMALTSDQYYNRGGLLAIHELLNSPEYIIALHLQPEHRQHILAVVEALITNPAFKPLMEKKASIHPDLEDLIRLDLKLSPEHPIASVHILYDAIMSMFGDIRQKDSPNCYAIAALIYAIENETFIYFEKTLLWLKQGYVSLSDRFTLPIQPLVEKRLHYISDLSCRLKFEDTIALAPFKHISGAFGITSLPSSFTDQPVTIRSTLSKLLEDSDSSEHLPYAERMYVAYKSNTLVLMHLAVCELTYMNISDKGWNGAQCVSKDKSKFIHACLSAIIDATARQKFYSPKFMTAMKTRLQSILWLENCNEQQVSIYFSSIQLRNRMISHFTGDCYQLASVFRESLRVFAFDGKKYEMIDKISDLQRAIISASNDTSLELKSITGLSFSKDYFLIKNAVMKHRFTVNVTNYCSNQIKMRYIRGIHLNEGNLLLMKQVGGIPDDVLRLVYSIPVKKIRVSGNATPYQFMNNLLEKLPALDSEAFVAIRKVLLFTPGHHIWTLNPYNWRFLMKNKLTFNQFIEDAVFSKVKRKLKRRIPMGTIATVIDRYTYDPMKRIALRNEFLSQSYTTYEKFSEAFVKSKNIADPYFAGKIIENAFSEISLTKQSLSRTLRILQIKLSSPQFFLLHQSLPLGSYKPYILARTLRERLIEQKLAIKHPHDIENALCRSLDEPLSFHVGDSNWLHKNTEDPYHVELCIGYHYGKNTLVYRTRFPHLEEVDSNSQYNTVEIQYPKT